MIKLHTDHYFHIGNTHLYSGKPCQDYAISDVNGDIAYGAVSDGCSTGRHTDVGSRILALSTATAIIDHWKISSNIFDDAVAKEVNLRQNLVLAGIRQTLGLIVDDMLATCAYAYITPLGGVAHIHGDGVIALKYRDGHIVMTRYDWEDNTPFYPAYNEAELDQFIKAHGSDLAAHRLKSETWTLDTEGEFIDHVKAEYSLSEGIRGVTIEIPVESLFKEIEFIGVCSDGVTQVDQLDWKDAVAKFMAFKNTTGEFAKRRMIRVIKDVQKIGKGPLDDISYSVIRVEQVEEVEVPDEQV
jgi:hypothetical protein